MIKKWSNNTAHELVPFNFFLTHELNSSLRLADKNNAFHLRCCCNTAGQKIATMNVVWYSQINYLYGEK